MRRGQPDLSFAGAHTSDPGARFEVLSGWVPAELEAWRHLWRVSPHREPQACPDFVAAMAGAAEEPACAVYRSDGGVVQLPFLLRPIPRPGDPLDSVLPDVRDAITPYGYGGAFLEGEVQPRAFWSCWDRWAQRSNVVSLTLRRSVLPGVILPVDAASATTDPLNHVIVDVRLDDDSLLASFEGRVRTDIRKAVREGVSVSVDSGLSRLSEFVEVYLETMRRVDALPFYLFDEGVFERMHRGLREGMVLFHAVRDGQIISSELNLVGRNSAYYFLAGTRSNGRQWAPNQLMKFEVMKYLRDRGVAHYVLGGGYGSDDNLFRYKRSYAPNGVVPFQVECRTSLPDVAAQLLSQRIRSSPGWSPDLRFLPHYRSP